MPAMTTKVGPGWALVMVQTGSRHCPPSGRAATSYHSYAFWLRGSLAISKSSMCIDGLNLLSEFMIFGILKVPACRIRIVDIVTVLSPWREFLCYLPQWQR